MAVDVRDQTALSLEPGQSAAGGAFQNSPTTLRLGSRPPSAASINWAIRSRFADSPTGGFGEVT